MNHNSNQKTEINIDEHFSELDQSFLNEEKKTVDYIKTIVNAEYSDAHKIRFMRKVIEKFNDKEYNILPSIKF
jgi:hypothetical protein